MLKRKKRKKLSKRKIENTDDGGFNDSADKETTNPKAQQEVAPAWPSPQETSWRKPSLMLVFKTLGKYVL